MQMRPPEPPEPTVKDLIALFLVLLIAGIVCLGLLTIASGHVPK